MWRQIKKNRTDHCFQRPRPLTLVHLQSWTHRLITKRLLMSSVWSCSWSPATVQNNKPPCCHASERVLCTKLLCRVFMSHPPKVQETVLHSSAAWPTYESMNPFIFLFVWQPLTKRTSVTKEKFPWRHCPSTADLVPSSEPNRDGGRGTKGPRGLATDVYVSMVQVRLRLARVPFQCRTHADLREDTSF